MKICVFFFLLRNFLPQKKHSLPGHLPLHRLERLEKLLPNIISVQTQMWSYHLERYILELLIKILLQCLLLHRINIGKCCALVHCAFNISYAQSNIVVGNYQHNSLLACILSQHCREKTTSCYFLLFSKLTHNISADNSFS